MSRSLIEAMYRYKILLQTGDSCRKGVLWSRCARLRRSDMSQRGSDIQARFRELVDEIAHRREPLGTDFSSECWGAVAERIALSHGADPCDYFRFSRDVYEAAIRMNGVLPETQRNTVMLEFTRALAAAA